MAVSSTSLLPSSSGAAARRRSRSRSTVTGNGSRFTRIGRYALWAFSALDEPSEHGRDAVGKILRGGHFVGRGQPVDLDAVEGHNQLLGLSECDLIGSRSSPAALANAFADVEGETPRGSPHLAAKIRFSTRELANYPSDPTVELQGTPVDVEPMKVVLASFLHLV
jgi:hypothetical protein